MYSLREAQDTIALMIVHLEGAEVTFLPTLFNHENSD
jgi:hypothetical protein